MRTLAEADLARLELDWAWMMEVNVCPFCSSAILFAAAVLPLKNVSQLVVIRADADADGGALVGE